MVDLLLSFMTPPFTQMLCLVSLIDMPAALSSIELLDSSRIFLLRISIISPDV